MKKTVFRTISFMAAFAAMLVLSACSAVGGGTGATSPPAPGAATSAASLPADQVLQPPAALQVEGVPPLPRQRLVDIQRYSRIAGHQFVQWHPLRAEMLVSHRPEGARATQLFLLDRAMGSLRALTDGADPVRAGRWEPNEGRYLIFNRARGGNEVYQLFRLDLATGTTTQLTPDDQRHALVGWVPQSGRVMVASVPVDRTAVAGKRQQVVTTLSLIDPLQPANTWKLAEMPGGGWFGDDTSPDGKTMALTRYISAGESEVWLIDLQDGQRRRVLPAPADNTRASHQFKGWTTDGQALLFTSDRASEFAELMRLDVATGGITRLSANIPWDVTDADVSMASVQPLASMIVNVDGRDELRLIDPRSGAAPSPARLTGTALPAGSITQAAFHPRLPLLALVSNSPKGPSQVYSLDLRPGTPQALQPWTQPAGTEGLDLSALPDQQIVRWPSFDGRTISGVLSLPPAHFGNRRPVVMVMHGGPESQSKQGWQGRLNYLVQQMGLAVLEPNVRGSRGYGKTFLTLDNGRLREDSVKDMASAIDWVATQQQLDAQRVVVVGGSYGGYMALAAATRLSNRIAGAASAVGISNFVSFLENTETYRRDLRRVEYGDERDPAMRAFLHSISPLTHVAQINKPLMVSQGKNDPRVPWTESEQIVRSLQSRGTPVWYLLANNEGHGFAKRDNADYYFVALAEFLQRTLKP